MENPNNYPCIKTSFGGSIFLLRQNLSLVTVMASDISLSQDPSAFASRLKSAFENKITGTPRLTGLTKNNGNFSVIFTVKISNDYARNLNPEMFLEATKELFIKAIM